MRKIKIKKNQQQKKQPKLNRSLSDEKIACKTTVLPALQVLKR
jgi:hypothetical protein